MTMKRWAIGLAAVFIMLAQARQASAQLTLSLSLSQPSFTYPSADPDTGGGRVSSPIITVNYSVTNISNSQRWTLTMRADGDLHSGSATIPTTNTTWTGSFGSGTLTNTDQQLIRGKKDVTSSGTISFSLLNDWTYSTGTYVQTIIFTWSVQ